MEDDPRIAFATPPYPGTQQQEAPGLSSRMDPAPDHGERSYVGKGLLDGKVTLITGGDSGIGRAVAIAFAREGADVAIAYLPVEQEDAEETRRWIEQAGRQALLLPGRFVRRGVLPRDRREDGGRVRRGIDVLVNNAAAQVINKMIDDVTAEQVERSFRVNVFAIYYLCQAAGGAHAARGSSIINTTSQQAEGRDEVDAGVCGDEGGDRDADDRGCSNLLAPKGIRVNCVAPGPVVDADPADREGCGGVGGGWARRQLSAGPGSRRSWRGAYVLLASHEGSYMTGALIPVTGGAAML